VAIRQAGSLKVTATSYAPDATGLYRLDVTSQPGASGADGGPAGGAVAQAFDQAPSTADFIPNALRIARELLGSRRHHRVDLPPPPSAGAAPAPTPAPGAPTAPPGAPPTPAPGATAALGTPLAIGAQQEGRLEPGDETLATGEHRDLYSFVGEAGSQINIELQSSDFDPYLILVSPSGQQWENDDANVGGGNLNSQILMTLPEAGTYRVVATSYRPGGSGAYLLKLRTGASGAGPVSPAVAEPAGAVRTIEGALEASDQRLSSGEHVDRHEVTLQAGQPVQVRLASTAFDTYLIIRSPGGQQWDNDDFQAGSLGSGIDLVPPQAGSYSIAVTSYRSGETGAYTLTITTLGGASAVAGVAPVPLPTPGVPTSPPPPVPSTGGPVPGAPAVAVAPVPGVPTIPPTPGVPPMPTPGLPTAPATSPGAPPTAPIQGTLAQGDRTLGSGEFTDTYPMIFQAGQRVSLRVNSTAFDTYLIVRAPSGRQFDNDDLQPGNLNSGLDVTLTETGQYSVVVTSYRPGETGAYTLAVTTGAGGAPLPTPGAPPMPGTPGVTPPMPGAPSGAPAPGGVRPQPGGGRVYGIYVGITAYPSGRLPLCAEDAIKLAQDMRRAGLQTEAEQILLTDANASAERVRQAFADMSRRVGPNDVFIFFYSGHGSQSGEQSGSTELDRREESINTYRGDITDDEMARLFGQIRARVSIIALDSCFSGGFARDVISAPGRMGFFSSEEDLTSSVAGRFQAGGYLSHFLRLGLRGEADSSPRDSLLTAGELSHYLFTMFGRHMQEVRAETTDSSQGYQHLVIDRGSVRVSTPIVRY